jgi:hypothetical protein
MDAGSKAAGTAVREVIYGIEEKHMCYGGSALQPFDVYVMTTFAGKAPSST